MPELPEVQTTVNGINETLKGLRIVDVWSDYNSTFAAGKENIKNKKFFTKFKCTVLGNSILEAQRSGKNIKIHLSNKHTILIHMKMTGHLLYGTFTFDTKDKVWIAKEKGPL